MPDYIICLEDGKKFKSLKRHLRTHYNLSPEEYREKWGLPPDYPMVAPNYANARSQLAKKMGLGTPPRSLSALTPAIYHSLSAGSCDERRRANCSASNAALSVFKAR